MKGLLKTGAMRAWLVVALVGLVVVALVPAIGLGSRLPAGQKVIDATRPALTDERLAGERAGIDFISRYVDFADPLMTARGGGSREIATLVEFLARRMQRPQSEIAAVLRREAPHTEALLRALPLTGVANEIPLFTRYLATTLNVSDEALATELEQSFPKLSQTLTALPSVTSGWNDIPGIGGLTRFDGTTDVTTVPQLRTYLRRDLVGTLERQKDDFDDLAGSGGIGYVPRLLLVFGALVVAFAVLQVRRAANAPPAPGRLAWGIVGGAGLLLLVLVLVLQYFPRLNGGDRVVAGLAPVFADARVQGDRAGADMLHQTILLGDPIANNRGGAGDEVPELLSFVAERTGTKRADVLRSLRRRAPRVTALLQAIPLSAVAAEIPHLLTYLARQLRLSRAELLAELRDRTPRLAQSILAVRPVAIRWNSIPGTERFTRFDASTPVRGMGVLDEYLSEDVLPVLESQGENFRDFDGSPPLDVIAPLLVVLGALLAIYGVAMVMNILTKRW